MSMFMRTFLVLALLVVMAACGGRQRSSDLLTDARAAVDGAADAERCAEAEYRAAVRLMEQAEQAYAYGNEALGASYKAALDRFGTPEAAREAAYTKSCAEWLGWKFEHLEGDGKLLRDLLAGRGLGGRHVGVDDHCLRGGGEVDSRGAKVAAACGGGSGAHGDGDSGAGGGVGDGGGSGRLGVSAN